jgi:hypothetical protein
MEADSHFRYRGTRGWRIPPAVGPSVDVGRVAYRLDVGIRHEMLVGYTVEANLALITELMASLLRVTRPTGELHVEARSWLEDFREHAVRLSFALPHEAGDGGKSGFFFRCDTEARNASKVISCFWSWSCEFSIRFLAAKPFTSPVELRMFPEHIDVAELVVSEADEPLVKGLFESAA